MALLFTIALAAIATSAIYLSSTSAILGGSLRREQQLRYATEAALAMGKSRLNRNGTDTLLLPDSSYATLMSNSQIVGADGKAMPGVTVNLYAGRTGSTSGQFGNFASLVADAKDASGAHFVRRLELAEESFAKFAVFTDLEGPWTTYWVKGINAYGPVWSNDIIHIYWGMPGAEFHDEVGTAQYVESPGAGLFFKTPPYRQSQRRIELPPPPRLARLSEYAGPGNFSFTAPTNGDESTVRMRIELKAVDLDGSGDSTGVDEGFFRVYTARSGSEQWLRGDFNQQNCGDWHTVRQGGRTVRAFFPAAIHSRHWVDSLLTQGALMTQAVADAETAKNFNQVMMTPGSQCFPGGDPHLVAVERLNYGSYAAPAWQKGGEDTTFTPVGNYGSWTAWPGAIASAVSAARPNEAAYLFPIYRGYNPGTKGVVHVNGTVALDGTLRGHLTVYATGTIVQVKGIRYATDPGSPAARCDDGLGVISGGNYVIADNGVQTPRGPGWGDLGDGQWHWFNETHDVHLQMVLMTLNTSLVVEHWWDGPQGAGFCDGTWWGRGCFYMTGGLIQSRTLPTGMITGWTGTGILDHYSYDRCAKRNPPPYFPTTGRFFDNRYSEIEPVGFAAGTLFDHLRPHQ